MNRRTFTEQELRKEASKLCRIHWGVDYTGGIELVQERWEERNALFIVDHDNDQRCIQMSRPRNAERSLEGVIQSLLHELVHWRLQSLGLPFRDTDDAFIEEAIRVGASISLAEDAQKAYRNYLTRTGNKIS
ncbi:hypothetical protein CR205_03195 [Alteribacter lacisalsi]|uniref:SprT-like domain-containing protein n=1 Tax=Alteribacter lacisalsi TaxID=2045244 RepID=A0A2W0HJD1_9BACI|nr:hypothetical protein [Alteribacter lacisalsi]PYZ97615.1 hypothetical protein CR205_03195 [Alteribacter lacisalsi]